MTSRVQITTHIEAPLTLCFDLSRDLNLHVQSMSSSGEKAVGGKTSGLIGLDEEVTFEGRHFGVRLRHTSRITVFDRPRHFRDEMVHGQFKEFRHDHYFEPSPAGTTVSDVLEFRSPFGVIGMLVDRLVLKLYLARLLRQRNTVIKIVAESVAARSS